jgi:magnesium transporter
MNTKHTPPAANRHTLRGAAAHPHAKVKIRGRSIHVRKRTPPGSSPGTLVVDAAAQHPTIRVTTYTADRLSEIDVTSVSKLPSLIDKGAVTWIDVQGLGDLETIQELGKTFGIHALALEDIVNAHQRPKVEIYRDHVFIVTRMPAAEGGATTEQLAMFLGDSYLLTFQEFAGDSLEPVRNRLRTARGGRMRSAKADYLAYALLDTAIDGYFPVLEKYGEDVEDLENDVVGGPEVGLIDRIHAIKRDLLTFRRALWPQREMINALIRDEHPLIEDQTKTYLRDCYDHTIQLVDVLETYREIASGLIDVYLSSLSARMNETMKVLTFIATIFIPLGFIASLYGMNFSPEKSPWNMPELSWYYGYPYALALMAAIALGMVLYFRSRGWIGKGPAHRRDLPDES